LDIGAAADWHAFASRDADLFERWLLERYYRPETFESEEARVR